MEEMKRQMETNFRSLQKEIDSMRCQSNSMNRLPGAEAAAAAAAAAAAKGAQVVLLGETEDTTEATILGADIPGARMPGGGIPR